MGENSIFAAMAPTTMLNTLFPSPLLVGRVGLFSRDVAGDLAGRRREGSEGETV
ncbi:hypothetical protein SAMD00023353_2300030 [Rosellinia necatrix]|uniref:Uncharacterized protein n=1 Tax=Rosellinia necatrix TaxID=77044 RepID=A0A1S8A7S8_ROSNE|nr:hypothetical protein SAMD00023353_2300030 [Rosellinia necatrix]